MIPTLALNNIFYKSDKEKGQLFGELLASTFTPNPDLINSTTEYAVNYEISNFFSGKNEKNLFESITITEIILAINKIKENSASGPDFIHNLMLKNLPESTLYDILNLFNQSLTTSQTPNNWKKAQVTMIPKKAQPTQDPSNYRPISLTS
ncbi:RNA-directed DNA polymerase from transposon X, partial [Brachionus plicatilis]